MMIMCRVWDWGLVIENLNLGFQIGLGFVTVTKLDEGLEFGFEIGNWGSG